MKEQCARSGLVWKQKLGAYFLVWMKKEPQVENCFWAVWLDDKDSETILCDLLMQHHSQELLSQKQLGLNSEKKDSLEIEM